HDVHGRLDLNAALPTLAGMTGTDPVSVARALDNQIPLKTGSTTNISVVDAEGNACVVTTTLGLGSGVWIRGRGIHLNSMLGETELLAPGPLPRDQLSLSQPGNRMASMMCPLVVTNGDGLVLAAGSAGASRIRTALTHTLVGVLADGLSVAEAIARPRFHPANGILHVEPGLPESTLDALAEAGFTLRHWDAPDLYFGGASAVGASGAAGDPRRGGKGVLV
ncbi:MAG: gamma-glutamyltransferase, partial [Longispora sp.]|nr:gamma-glutamyltransferase [Longispora sp. (in: high G+C Gram-positive bacteria)]